VARALGNCRLEVAPGGGQLNVALPEVGGGGAQRAEGGIADRDPIEAGRGSLRVRLVELGLELNPATMELGQAISEISKPYSTRVWPSSSIIKRLII